MIIVARIGDTLLATPVVNALAHAYPGARLTVLAHPKRADLLQGLPAISRLGPITPATAGWRALAARLRGDRYDAAVVLGHDPELVRYALRLADRVAAFPMPGLPLSPKLTLAEPPPGPEHAVHERLRPALALGATPAGLRLAYVPTAEERRQGTERLRRAFPGTAGPLIGIQLKSFPTKPYRDWPLESFRALIARLRAELPAVRVAILGDAASRDAARGLVGEFPGTVASLAGDMSLRELGAVLASLDLYVGVDTGPTHLAGAVGIPMVALYHCKHRGRFLAPLDHPRLEVIEHPADDAHCGAESSMAAIDVATVWDAVARQLTLSGFLR